MSVNGLHSYFSSLHRSQKHIQEHPGREPTGWQKRHGHSVGSPLPSKVPTRTEAIDGEQTTPVETVSLAWMLQMGHCSQSGEAGMGAKEVRRLGVRGVEAKGENRVLANSKMKWKCTI